MEGGGDSGTGTLRRKAAQKQRPKFQEEIDCEELSKELIKELPEIDNKLQDLLGKYFTLAGLIIIFCPTKRSEYF